MSTITVSATTIKALRKLPEYRPGTDNQTPDTFGGAVIRVM